MTTPGEGLPFVVRSGDLVFSVNVFSICALLAIMILIVRRRKVGAELGGPTLLKFVASFSLVVLWVGYIGLSGWCHGVHSYPTSRVFFHQIKMSSPILMFVLMSSLYNFDAC